MPTSMNAANEVAVDAFLNKQIPFTAIFETIDMAMTTVDTVAADSLDAVLATDKEARAVASRYIESKFRSKKQVS